jgi:cytochrome c biogenesis protein
MQTLRSVQFAVVVLIAIAADAMVGTLVPQGQPYEFYEEQFNPVIVLFIRTFRLDDTYRSPLFLGLMGLFWLNLFLCTIHRLPGLLKTAFGPGAAPDTDEIGRMPIHSAFAGISLQNVRNAFAAYGFRLNPTGDSRLFGEKGRIGHFGSMVVHLGLMVLLAGGVTSLITGKRGSIVLEEGERTSLAALPDDRKIPLGFTVALDSFRVAFYEAYPNRPKSYTSSVTITRKDNSSFKKDIRVNHPLMLNRFTLYQSSYGVSKRMIAASGVIDTARVEIRLRGAPSGMPPIATIDMSPGGVYPIPGFGDSIAVRLAELHRNFRMGGPEEASNPAVKLDVLVRGETRWNVYAFKNYPGLNMPMHRDMDFSFAMLDLMTGSPASATNLTPQYFTVLGAVRDRGIPLVWGGAVLMMTGLLLSFTIRPRRILAFEENGTVHFGAWTKGDTEAFREFVLTVIKRAEHPI